MGDNWELHALEVVLTPFIYKRSVRLFVYDKKIGPIFLYIQIIGPIFCTDKKSDRFFECFVHDFRFFVQTKCRTDFLYTKGVRTTPRA